MPATSELTPSVVIAPTIIAQAVSLPIGGDRRGVRKGGERPVKETREERFRRVAEARVNKIIAEIRLLGNLSRTGTYEYTPEQVDKIFRCLELEISAAQARFADPQKKRFSLSESAEQETPGTTYPCGTSGAPKDNWIPTTIIDEQEEIINE